MAPLVKALTENSKGITTDEMDFNFFSMTFWYTNQNLYKVRATRIEGS